MFNYTNASRPATEQIIQWLFIKNKVLLCIPGSFTCLNIQFILRRDLGFYLLQVYIPSGLIVILSWLSFCVNLNAVAERITLGVTTVLTMVTQLAAAKGIVPKVCKSQHRVHI